MFRFYGGNVLGRKFFVSDCEGPISLNDNAFELSGYFIENGEKFFEVVSKYDDVLSDVIKREGYTAGGTLKLILPFLKAYGATDQRMTDFSMKNVHLMPGAVEALDFIRNSMPSFIVSTSYEHYIRALCSVTGFPYENTYSTQLDIDSYSLSPEEEKKLKEFRKNIEEHPEFEVLDEIFFKEVPSMDIGSVLEDVKTVGGENKKEAVQDIISSFKFKASDLMYVGDSITDVQPLRFAAENRGIGISFNGNDYALNEAEIAVIADNNSILAVLADIFNRYNSDAVLDFVVSYFRDPELALEGVNPQLAEKVRRGKLPRMEIVTCENLESLIKESTRFRKNIRGKIIGGLG
jgi:energy-converting hydrogenase A subunit R